MTDKSFFTEEEWKALTEAPLAVTLAMVAVGQHGPISMVKEAAASAREIAKLPPEEAGEVRAWLLDIAKAVGDASKGTTDEEAATIERIRVALAGA